MNVQQRCERNKAQIIRLFDHDFSVYETIMADDICVHGPATGQETKGVVAVKQLDKTYADAYPDAKYIIHDIIAVEDKVVVRWTVSATHLQERRNLHLHGQMKNIAATHKKILLNGTHIYRFNDEGKIIDSWAMWDRLRELEQITQIIISDAHE